MALRYKYILLIFLILFDMGFIPHFSEYNIENKIVVIIFYFLTAFAIFKIFLSSKKQRDTRKSEEKALKELIECIRNNKEPSFQETPLILNPREHAYICITTKQIETKTKAVGSVGSSGGISFNLGGGVRLHTGSGHRRTIYNDIKKKYTGEFVITNQRIAFINNKKGFEIPISKITSLTTHSHYLVIQANKNSYTLMTKQSQILNELIREISKQKEAKKK